jgi:hypothetical protein
MVLAGAVGTSDVTGAWGAEAIDEAGRVLADIQVVDAEPDTSFAVRVSTATPNSNGAPGPVPGTFAGFADGVGLDRTLTVDTSAPPGSFHVTVGMMFSYRELAEAGLDLPDAALHVLDERDGPTPGAWAPAGIDVGESLPTGQVGDSGFFVDADEVVTFWAVQDRKGIFAVGAFEGEVPAEVPDEEDVGPFPTPVPPMCGVGLLPLWPVGVASLLVTRARRSRRRSIGPA